MKKRLIEEQVNVGLDKQEVTNAAFLSLKSKLHDVHGRLRRLWHRNPLTVQDAFALAHNTTAMPLRLLQSGAYCVCDCCLCCVLDAKRSGVKRHVEADFDDVCDQRMKELEVFARSEALEVKAETNAFALVLKEKKEDGEDCKRRRIAQSGE